MVKTLLGTLVVIAAFMATHYLLQRKRESKRLPSSCGGACLCRGDAAGCRDAGETPPRASSEGDAP